MPPLDARFLNGPLPRLSLPPSAKPEKYALMTILHARWGSGFATWQGSDRPPMFVVLEVTK